MPYDKGPQKQKTEKIKNFRCEISGAYAYRKTHTDEMPPGEIELLQQNKPETNKFPVTYLGEIVPAGVTIKIGRKRIETLENKF